MRRFSFLLLLLALEVGAQPALRVEATTFTPENGAAVEAEIGRFRVPENRALEDGRTIELAFVRFPSTNPNPGPPIVYLAGGPGGSGSGTARGSRFDLFQSLRGVADVIAFDQRGTGLSEQLPDCPHETVLPLDVPGSRESYTAAWAETARACAAHWRRAGVDLDAYNTEESADDLEALRLVLEADQIALWSISYGTHLALATIRRHPSSISSAVMAGVEGPDHTDKMPRDQQDILERIDAIQRAESPDATFLEDIEAVLERLREAPVEVALEDGTVAITAFDVQWLAANMLGAPDLSLQLPELFQEMRADDFSGVAFWIRYLKSSSGMGAMSVAMDAASGASLWRQAQIASQGRETLLGDAINFPSPVIRDAIRVRDLGPAFRSPVLSDVPTLFISGTLDGRTAPANAEEVRAGFSRHAHLVLEGAGHSDPLFLSSPLILERIRTVFSGGMVESETLEVGP